MNALYNTEVYVKQTGQVIEIWFVDLVCKIEKEIYGANIYWQLLKELNIFKQIHFKTTQKISAYRTIDANFVEQLFYKSVQVAIKDI